MSAIRTIGVVGDVHAEDRRLEATLGFLRARGVDAILCVGDIADGFGDLDRTCALLGAPDVQCVAGNHDRWLLDGICRDVPRSHDRDVLRPESVAFFRALPPSRRLETVAGRLLLCHGMGDDDMAAVRPEDYGYALSANEPLQGLLAAGEIDLVVNGHTHRRMVRRIDRLTILNAGTLHRDYGPGFLLADLEARRAAFYDLDDDTPTLAEELEFPP